MTPQTSCSTSASKCTIDLILVVNQVWLWVVDDRMAYFSLASFYTPCLLAQTNICPRNNHTQHDASVGRCKQRLASARSEGIGVLDNGLPSDGHGRGNSPRTRHSCRPFSEERNRDHWVEDVGTEGLSGLHPDSRKYIYPDCDVIA